MEKSLVSNGEFDNNEHVAMIDSMMSAQKPKMTIEKLARMTANGFADVRRELATKASKTDLKGFATKEDLKGFATKEDLKGFATKEDLKGFATKEDLKGFATKEDLKGFATKE